MKAERCITVYDTNNNLLEPCSKKVAWVLVNRNRAIEIDENSIKIIVSNKDIKELKKKVIKRDNMTCIYCNNIISEDDVVTIDHLNSKQIKKNGVGYDTEENMACSCIHCNRHKRNMNFDEYVVYRYALFLAFAYFKSNKNIQKEVLKYNGIYSSTCSYEI